MSKLDLDVVFVKALGYFKSNKPGSDRLLYDLLAEYMKRPSRWLNRVESTVSDVTETLVISEESSSSSDISKAYSDSAGAGTEIVELVSLDELPSNLSKKPRLEPEKDIVDDDDISQLMSETGVVMVMEEQSHVTEGGHQSLVEEDDIILIPKNIVFTDDEETDSCDEFEGFSRVSSREETPDRFMSQSLASSSVSVPSNHRSLTPPARVGPPPLTRVDFNRSISWDKSVAGRQSPVGRDAPPLLYSSTPIAHPKPVYTRPTSQCTPSSPHYATPAKGSAPRRFHQMKRQASQLAQNVKGPAKKQT